jgi:hypothetical protein
LNANTGQGLVATELHPYASTTSFELDGHRSATHELVAALYPVVIFHVTIGPEGYATGVSTLMARQLDGTHAGLLFLHLFQPPQRHRQSIGNIVQCAFELTCSLGRFWTG